MSAEFWTILGVGATLLIVAVTTIGLGWKAYSHLDTKIDRKIGDVEARVAKMQEDFAYIRGWIEGKFEKFS